MNYSMIGSHLILTHFSHQNEMFEDVDDSGCHPTKPRNIPDMVARISLLIIQNSVYLMVN